MKEPIRVNFTNTLFESAVKIAGAPLTSLSTQPIEPALVRSHQKTYSPKKKS